MLSLIENKRYREILELRYRKGFSIEEISEMQGRTPKAVYHSIERALHRAHEIAWKLKLTDTPSNKRANGFKNNFKIFQIWWGKTGESVFIQYGRVLKRNREFFSN